MPRTVDHIVHTHRLAQARRDAGLPIWDRKVLLGDVFRNEAMSFEQIRDEIARRIRATEWHSGSDVVRELVDELADCADTDEFDAVWDAIYDEADEDRVWIETVK
jgi:hypothetical protein